MAAPRWIERPVRAALRGSTIFLPDGQRDEIAEIAWDSCVAAASRGGLPTFARTMIGELADLLSIRLRQRAGLGPRITAGGSRPPFWRGTPMAVVEDFRRAFRRLRSSRSALALSIGMLALAIGVASAMFTVLDALVLHPVPFHDAGRLTRLVIATEERYLTGSPPAAIRAWRASGVFAGVEAAVQSPVAFEGPDGVFTQGAGRITPGLLGLLGVRPILGRGFVEGEGRPGTSDRILLSEELWTAKFNRDPSIVGRTVRVSGIPTEIIGVMPAGFRFPYANTRAWRPIDFDAPPVLGSVERAGPMAFARLKPDVPPADALRQADAALRAALALPPDQHTAFRGIAAGMVDAYSRQSVMALSFGVVLVFLVLCANAMNLMLTRFAARHREFGVCWALGASRSRLIREAVAETVLVGLVAAGLGLMLAHWLVKLVIAYLPDVLPRTLTPVAINWRALAATSILALLAAAIAGLTPAWVATRIDAADALRTMARTGSDRPSQRRLARGLLIGEIALAAALLAGAAQLARTFVNLVRADRGLNSDGIITGWVALPRFAFTDKASRLSFAAALDDRLKRLPGVSEVSLSGGVPPQGGSIYFGPFRSGRPGASEVKEVNAYDVTPQFFDLFGIRLLRGQTFTTPAAESDVILGEQLAKLLFPDGDDVGRSFTIDGFKAPFLVVGVVREIRTPSFDPRSDSPEMYHPLMLAKDGRVEASALGSGQINVALRCGTACPAIDVVTRSIRDLSALAEVVSMGPMDDAYLKGLARPRAAAALAGSFALVALLASAGGLFSVLSAAVSRRRREFGIRVALGIEPARLTTLVVRQAFGIAAVGLGFGVLGAWTLNRVLSSLTYGVSPADPMTWAAVFGSLALTTILAAWRPGAQAARVDPAELLRTE
jgi:putative ABC transport system permease protein